MKRFVSCLAVLAILVSMVLPLPLSVKAEDTMSVRILNDFEAATLTQTNSKIESTGAQANSFVAGGYQDSTGLKMYNDNDGWLEYVIYSYDATGVNSTWRDEWQEAKYIQFYVDNRGPGKVYASFTSMKKNSGAMDHHQDYNFTESTQFIGSSDGITWTNLDKQVNGNGFYEVIIPENFKGFVRAELNTTNLSYPDPAWGAYEGQIGKLEMTFGVKNSTVFIDDVALVGNFANTVEGYQFAETVYFSGMSDGGNQGGGDQEDGVQIRMLNDFSPNAILDAKASVTSQDAQSNTIEAGGRTDSAALRMYNDNNGWVVYSVFGYESALVASSWRSDWTDAEYLQFYVDNQGTGEAGITYGLSDSSGRYSQEICWPQSALKVLAMTEGTDEWQEWEPADNVDGAYGVIVPGGFKGYIRMEIDLTKMQCTWQNVQLSMASIGVLRLYANVKNSTVFVDDVALVGNFANTVAGYQFTEADYFSGMSDGGDQGDDSDLEMDMEEVSDTRVFQDFEDASLNGTNAGITSQDAQSNTIEAGGKDGTNALKMYNDNNGWVSYNLYGYYSDEVASAWRADWTGAKYIQFYVDNQGTGTAGITYGLTDHYSRYSQEICWPNSALKVYAMDETTGEWERWKPADNVDGCYGVEIPAGFKGYIRMEIDLTKLQCAWENVQLSMDSIGMCRVFVNAKNTTIFVDEFALAGDFAPEIEMPEDIENIKTILDFEYGVSDIGSGINYIPLTFSQTNEWAASGTHSLKLVVTAAGGSVPRLSQVQPASFYGDASTAQYLEFSVKNASSVPFGITWCSLNGTSFSANSAQIAIYKHGKWYAVDLYDGESFMIPANYEGKIRIKLGEGGVPLSDTLISKFEFAVKETTKTVRATLYMDNFCLIGTPLPEVVYDEVTMPSDLDLIKTVFDFETINIVSVRSGINFLPVNFSLGTSAANSGNALIVTTGVGGATPNLSQIQPAKFFQNWTGGQYLEIWISNPNDFDFAYCWPRIRDISYNNEDIEISLQFEDGKWYRAQTGGDANGAVIPAGFTGKMRVKLDDRFGDLVMVEGLEFALWCAADIAGQKIYIDNIVVLGDIEQHVEPEVPNSVNEFPVESILEKIADGQKVFDYQVTQNIPVPAEIIEAIKGKDIVFSYTVLNKFGIGLYRWTLVGSELTDVTEFYPVVTLEEVTEIEDARVKGFKVENGDVKGAYLSLNVRKDFPSFTVMYVYDTTAKTLLDFGNIVNEFGWFTVSLEEDGEYLLADALIESYDNDIYPTEGEDSEPSESETTKPSDSEGDTSPDTGDFYTGLIICMLVTSLAATGILVRNRKER